MNPTQLEQALQARQMRLGGLGTEQIAEEMGVGVQWVRELLRGLEDMALRQERQRTAADRINPLLHL